MLTDKQLAGLCADTYSPDVSWAFAGPTFHATLTVTGDETIIACEGSVSVADWLRDFDVIGPATFTHPWLGIIHNGFYQTTEECLPEIVAKLAGIKNVSITGHSKGAANAEILACKLVYNKINVTNLVTFGTPRWILPYNNLVPHLIPASLGTSYRHFKDIVTEVPFPPMEHPASRPVVEIGTGTALQLLDVEWMHHIENYEASLP